MFQFHRDHTILASQQEPIQYPHVDIPPPNDIGGLSGVFVVGFFVGATFTKSILK